MISATLKHDHLLTVHMPDNKMGYQDLPNNHALLVKW